MMMCMGTKSDKAAAGRSKICATHLEKNGIWCKKYQKKNLL